MHAKGKKSLEATSRCFLEYNSYLFCVASTASNQTHQNQHVLAAEVEQAVDLLQGAVGAPHVRTVGLVHPVSHGEANGVDTHRGNLRDVALRHPRLPVPLELFVSLQHIFAEKTFCFLETTRREFDKRNDVVVQKGEPEACARTGRQQCGLRIH